VSFLTGKVDQLSQEHLMEKQKLNTALSNLENNIEKERADRREMELALKELETRHKDILRKSDSTNEELRLTYDKFNHQKSHIQKIIKEHDNLKEKSTKESESL